MNLPTINTQPNEGSIVHDEGEKVDIVSVFDTIQGEGPFVGTPAVFVRLAGCNLKCPGCDTDYTTGRELLGKEQILNRIWDAIGTRTIIPLIVLTGGEPFRQKLGPFVRHLMVRLPNTKIQIETNGTLYQEDFPWYNGNLHVVVSPKTTRIDPHIMQKARAVKYIVRAGEIDPESGLPMKGLGYSQAPANFRDYHFDGEVFLQPMDETNAEQNEKNRQAAVKACMQWGYRLSLQTHKYLGLK